jgi:hypothetical protein
MAKSHGITVIIPPGYPLHAGHAYIMRVLCELLSCEHKGAARGVVKDLRVALHSAASRATADARIVLQSLLTAVNNFETQTFEELRANVLAVCALIDIRIEEAS